MRESTTYPELHAAYRRAYLAFAHSVRTLQMLVENQNLDDASLEAALLEVERTRVVYNSARDRLAQALLKLDLPAISRKEVSSVRRLASLFWELNGRPSGTAEADWRRAEKLVQSTVEL